MARELRNSTRRHSRQCSGSPRAAPFPKSDGGAGAGGLPGAGGATTTRSDRPVGRTMPTAPPCSSAQGAARLRRAEGEDLPGRWQARGITPRAGGRPPACTARTARTGPSRTSWTSRLGKVRAYKQQMKARREGQGLVAVGQFGVEGSRVQAVGGGVSMSPDRTDTGPDHRCGPVLRGRVQDAQAAVLDHDGDARAVPGARPRLLHTPWLAPS